MAVNAADAWQQSGGRPERPHRAPRADRAMAAERPRSPRNAPPPPRSRAADRPRERNRAEYYDGAAPQYSRPPVPRPPAERSRPVPRDVEREYDDYEVDSRAERSGRRPAVAAEATGSKLRGIVAVVAVFLVTLAAAGVESFLATGLGRITMVALVASTAIATILVRRRDILSVVVSPPLVFVAVAVVNMLAAPSVQVSGVKAFGLLMITLLVQNFLTMAAATAVALVIGVVRLAARR